MSAYELTRVPATVYWQRAEQAQPEPGQRIIIACTMPDGTRFAHETAYRPGLFPMLDVDWWCYLPALPEDVLDKLDDG